MAPEATPQTGFVRAGSSKNPQAATASRYVKPRRKNQILLIVLAIVAALLVAIAVYAAFMVGSVQRVRASVTSLQSEAQTLTSAVSAGKVDELQVALSSTVGPLGDDIAAVKQELSSTVWKIAGALPIVGADVTAASQLVDAADTLTTQVLVPLSATMETFPIKQLFQDGVVNADGLKVYCALVTQVTPAVQSATATLGSVHAPHIDQVNTVAEKLAGLLGTANEALTKYGSVVSILPDLLGCNGQRAYVMTAQNLVEIRPTGGFPGALALMTVENGALELGDFFSCNYFSSDEAIRFETTQEEKDIFGQDPGKYYGNTNFIYDFPRAASLWSQFWLRDDGVVVDGIIAIDPIFLQGIVGLLGDVPMSDGVVLTGSNTVTVLEHDVYWTYTSNAEQDAYFAEAAFNTLEQFTSRGSGLDFSALLDLIETSIDKGNLLVWMADANEQSVLEDFGCTGSVGDDPTKPVLGVYFSDNTGSKYDWYLDTDTQIVSTTANADGSTSYAMVTTYTNTATQEDLDAAESIGALNYIFGVNADRYYDGDMMTTIYLAAPAGATITDYSMSNGDMLYDYPYNGHQSLHVMSHIDPGESIVVTYTVTTAPGAEPLTIKTTPTTRSVTG